MGFGSLGEAGLNSYKRSRRTMRMGKQFAQVEIPVRLEIKPQDLKRLEQSGKYALKNTLRPVSRFVLEPSQNEAIKLSGSKIGRRFAANRTGRGGKTTYNVKGKSRKIRSYRAGVRKKSAYSMRGRNDTAGRVTMLLSIKTNADYYNFVANFWEHGWKVGGKQLPGNQFMTKAVERNRNDIAGRFCRAMAKAIEVLPKRLKASDLKGIR